MNNQSLLTIEQRLKELSERRSIVERRIELREATFSEFQVVHKESIERTVKKLEIQNEGIKKRNEAFLNSIHLAINSIDERKKLSSMASGPSTKLKDAYKGYIETIDRLLPSWRQHQAQKQIEQLRNLQFEKETTFRRREVMKQEWESSQAINEAIEKERRELVLAMALEQRDQIAALAQSTVLREQGKAVDAAIISEVELASQQISKLVEEKAWNERSSIDMAVRKHFPPQTIPLPRSFSTNPPGPFPDAPAFYRDLSSIQDNRNESSTAMSSSRMDYHPHTLPSDKYERGGGASLYPPSSSTTHSQEGTDSRWTSGGAVQSVTSEFKAASVPPLPPSYPSTSSTSSRYPEQSRAPALSMHEPTVDQREAPTTRLGHQEQLSARNGTVALPAPTTRVETSESNNWTPSPNPQTKEEKRAPKPDSRGDKSDLDAKKGEMASSHRQGHRDQSLRDAGSSTMRQRTSGHDDDDDDFDRRIGPSDRQATQPDSKSTSYSSEPLLDSQPAPNDIKPAERKPEVNSFSTVTDSSLPQKSVSTSILSKIAKSVLEESDSDEELHLKKTNQKKDESTLKKSDSKTILSDLSTTTAAKQIETTNAKKISALTPSGGTPKVALNPFDFDGLSDSDPEPEVSTQQRKKEVEQETMNVEYSSSSATTNKSVPILKSILKPPSNSASQDKSDSSPIKESDTRPNPARTDRLNQMGFRDEFESSTEDENWVQSSRGKPASSMTAIPAAATPSNDVKTQGTQGSSRAPNLNETPPRQGGTEAPPSVTQGSSQAKTEAAPSAGVPRGSPDSKNSSPRDGRSPRDEGRSPRQGGSGSERDGGYRSSRADNSRDNSRRGTPTGSPRTPRTDDESSGQMFGQYSLTQCCTMVNCIFELLEKLSTSPHNKIYMAYMDALKNPPDKVVVQSVGKASVQGIRKQLEVYGGDSLAAAVLQVVRERGSDILPNEALQGVVSTSKLFDQQKKLGGGRVEFWNCITQHLNRLVEARRINLDDFSKIFTEAFIFKADPGEKSRIERKVSQLLRLAVLPKDNTSSPRTTGSPSTNRSSLRIATPDPYATPVGSPPTERYSSPMANPSSVNSRPPLAPDYHSLDGGSSGFVTSRSSFPSRNSGNMSALASSGGTTTPKYSNSNQRPGFNDRTNKHISDMEELEVDDDMLNMSGASYSAVNQNRGRGNSSNINESSRQSSNYGSSGTPNQQQRRGGGDQGMVGRHQYQQDAELDAEFDF